MNPIIHEFLIVTIVSSFMATYWSDLEDFPELLVLWKDYQHYLTDVVTKDENQI